MAAKHSPSLSDRLLEWYDVHRRSLPWRAPPGEAPDPYRVWLSEVMLQQTTVATVTPRFAAWVARWPDFAALAAASYEDVMAAWAGLGYYARARNLLACAKDVVAHHEGRFPPTEAALRALPGIGDYTAAAIAAIAFGEPATVVDANVERVVARLFRAAGKPAVRTAAEAITPRERAGDFAQAMMDLGSGICTPRKPRCLLCPLRNHCAAFAAGDQAAFPVKPAKPSRPQRYGTIFWAQDGGDVLLVRRPPNGLLGGMRALPTGPWIDTQPGIADAPVMADWTVLDTTVSHGFTPFRFATRACDRARRAACSRGRRDLVAGRVARRCRAADRVCQGGDSDRRGLMRTFMTPILTGTAFAALLAGGALAQAVAPAPQLAPATVASPLPATQALFDGYVSAGKMPGIVGAFGVGDVPTVYVKSGKVAIDANVQAAGPDSLWRVYSMTKPVTAMAAMILIQDGKLKLDEPVSDILPAFKTMRVQLNENTIESRPAVRPITIRNLLTHTAGLGYNIITKGPLLELYNKQGINPAQVNTSFEAQSRPVRPPTLQEFANRVATLPLIADPGTKWSYSIGLDVMGAVIEKASGMAFDTFVQKRIFDPLKMRSSYWTVPRSETGRLVSAYTFVAGDRLAPLDPAATSVYLTPPSFPYGGAGLVMSAGDYDRFLHMLQNYGVLDGVRIMKTETAKLAMSDLLPPGVVFGSLPGGTGGQMAPRMGFGAGGSVILEDKIASFGAGTYGWGGAFGTIAFVNPVKKIRGTVMVNYFPGEKWPVRGDVMKALQADLARYQK